ncbi:MAG: hypothetical protein IJS74_00440 [Clostridia bacterium]|nr:hypothetical protein [Clostridia bacterium]
MFKIKNKLESLKTLKQLRLNTMPIEYFETYDEELLDKFFQEYDFKYYVVRDFGKASSDLFRFNLSKEQVKEHVKSKNAEKFVVNVSTFNFTGHQICTGAILIKRNMQISLSVTCEDNCSVRQAEVNPQYSFNCDIDDRRLDKIDGLDQVIDYIFKKNLFDVMVEFASMDIPVGTENEKVIIFELRTNY